MEPLIGVACNALFQLRQKRPDIGIHVDGGNYATGDEFVANV